MKLSGPRRLVCFDMDGVLVDACNLHKISLELAMQEELGFKISDEDHYTKFNGLPTRKKLQILQIPTDKIEIINSKKQKYTLSLVEKHIGKDESKIELLNCLKTLGYSLACVTNSIKHTTYVILKKCEILDYFDLVVTNECVKNPKPSPDPYLFAMRELGFKEYQTTIVEDSPTGLKSAYATNAKVIEVSGPNQVNLESLKHKLLNL